MLRRSQVNHPKHRRVTRSRPVIYRPESKMRRPRELVKEMWHDLLASRELAWQLLKRDINAQYRQSFLGIAWAIIPPLVSAVGFTLANHANVLNIGTTDLPYPAYVLLSTALWQTFAEAITLPMQQLTKAKGMLAKISFPREALILSGMGQVFFSFGCKLLLIVGMFIGFKIPITASAILAPVALVHMVIFGAAIGTLLAPLGALYNDVMKVISLVMGFLMFATPVVYPVPSGEGIFSTIVRLNPITPLLVTTRELATTGMISQPLGFWVSSGVGFIGLLLAWLVYKLTLPYAVERLSA